MESTPLILLPPLIVLVVAVKTRSTASSLFFGTIACCILQFHSEFFQGFLDLLYSVGTNESTVWYALFVSLFGCILGIWSSTGATRAVTDSLAQFATSQRRTLLITWLIGILMFIDDFTSIAIHGTMTKLYDNNKIPRAMLAYLAAATASPVCTLVPFGTWAIFYQSSFAAYGEVAALGGSMEVYLSMIPFMFYGWACIAIAFLVAAGAIKPLGGMETAYDRAQSTGELYSSASRRYNVGNDEQGESDSDMGKRMACFLIPLVVFVVCVMVTGDVIIACIITLATLIACCKAFRIRSWKGLMRDCMDGVSSMASLIVVVFSAYVFRDALIAIGLPDYVVSVAQPFMNPSLVPVITFLACAVLTFASGSNWGATLAVAAIIIPFCSALDGNLVLTLAAIVSGAAFGAHACFYCDVTIFTSGMTRIDNVEHATTQLPYCLIGALIAAASFGITGFALT